VGAMFACGYHPSEGKRKKKKSPATYTQEGKGEEGSPRRDQSLLPFAPGQEREEGRGIGLFQAGCEEKEKKKGKQRPVLLIGGARPASS